MLESRALTPSLTSLSDSHTERTVAHTKMEESLVHNLSVARDPSDSDWNSCHSSTLRKMQWFLSQIRHGPFTEISQQKLDSSGRATDTTTPLQSLWPSRVCWKTWTRLLPTRSWCCMFVHTTQQVWTQPRLNGSRSSKWSSARTTLCCLIVLIKDSLVEISKEMLMLSDSSRKSMKTSCSSNLMLRTSDSTDREQGACQWWPTVPKRRRSWCLVWSSWLACYTRTLPSTEPV